MNAHSSGRALFDGTDLWLCKCGDVFPTDLAWLAHHRENTPPTPEPSMTVPTEAARQLLRQHTNWLNALSADDSRDTETRISAFLAGRDRRQEPLVGAQEASA